MLQLFYRQLIVAALLLAPFTVRAQSACDMSNVCPSGATAPTVTQSSPINCRGFGNSPYTCTFSMSVATGDVIAVGFNANGTFVSVSGCGASWTSSTINSGFSGSSYGTGATSGSCTVSGAWANGFGELYAIDVNGSAGFDAAGAITCLDGSGNPTGTCGTGVATGTTLTGPSASCSANDLAVGIFINIGNSTATTFAHGTGWTSQGQSPDVFIETKTAAGGSVAPTAVPTSSTNQNYAAVTYCFKD